MLRFCEIRFKKLGIANSYKCFFIADKYKRDEELNYLRGCSDKLFNKINITFEYTFEEMIREMVDYHLKRLS